MIRELQSYTFEKEAEAESKKIDVLKYDRHSGESRSYERVKFNPPLAAEFNESQIESSSFAVDLKPSGQARRFLRIACRAPYSRES